MSRAVAGALLTAALAAACAQPGSPPGGPQDRSPPRVVAVSPEPFDTLRDLTRPVVIQFDERLSIRLQGVPEWRDAVLISPYHDPPVVNAGRRSLEILPAGGWQPDRVYQVTVLPVFRDLFGNQRREAVELVFSTGAPIPETAVAGLVEDRLTAEMLTGARIEAVRRIDGARYLAVSDTGGFFAYRFLPAGAYDVTAWVDQNRNREPNFFEAQATAELFFGVNDTSFIQLSVLPMDTTPARLARVEVLDSAKLRLVFDDYFAPGPIAGSTRLMIGPDSTLVTTSGRLLHGSRLDSVRTAEAAVREARREERARQDSVARADSLAADSLAGDAVAADSLPADSLVDPPPVERPVTDSARQGRRAAVDEARRRPTEDPRRRPGLAGDRRPTGARAGRAAGSAREEGPPLPSRELLLLLPGVLRPDTTYFIEVSGVTNIRGVPGGGGVTAFRTPEPAAPDSTAEAGADSVAADTTGPDGVPPDSVRPDSVRPDTIPPDTIPPDTIPPDTGAVR